jgi:hypothetical protein
MPSIYIPSNSAEQWAQFLAEPSKHWRRGFSARTLAYSWQEANGFPTEVRSILQSEDQFKELELLIAVPEHQVSLPGGSRPSQNDIWCLAKTPANLVSIAVEGKVEEPFGPTLGEWLHEASVGKSSRLAYLKEQLSLSGEITNEIRYQLLHRTASAVVEAKRFLAPQAIMLVHSFSPSQQWFADYAAFASLLGAKAEPNRLHSVGSRSGVNLHIGWVCGNQDYLSR